MLDMEKLQEMLLETLSFFSPMSAQMIILDFDREKIDSMRELTLEDLEKSLSIMVKKGLVRRTKSGEDIAWQRVFLKRKPWWRRFAGLSL